MMRGIIAIAAMGLLVSACGEAEQRLPAADLVLTGGKIQTMDAGRTWAEALCVTGTDINYVGSAEGAGACVGTATKVIDLAGRLVIPGLMDSHLHIFGGSISDVGVNLTLATTMDELRAALEEMKRLNPGTAPLSGRGWQNYLFDRFGPRKEMLDDVFGSERAVMLSSVDGHSTWYSSGALAAAGVDAGVIDPNPGVSFWERDPQTGELLGVAREGAGRELIDAKLLERTPDAYRTALKKWLPRASASGLTAVFDAGMGAPTLIDAYDILGELDGQGELPLRVYSSVPAYPDGTDNPAMTVLQNREKYSSAHHQPYSVKAFADGVPEGHTAYMLHDYADTPGDRGVPMTEPTRMHQVVMDAEKLGVPVHVHAIGGAAIRMALDAFEAARKFDVGAAARPRHAIGHMDYVDAVDVPRFAALDVIPQTSVQWATVDPSYDTFVSYVGKDVHDAGYPIRDILDAGGRQTFGTDWPAAAFLSTYKPLIQIETAVTRRLSGVESGPERGEGQGISVMEALEAMTRNTAYQLGVEDQLGSLEVGKRADILVLGGNLFDMPPHEIHQTEVQVTIMDGKIVHSTGKHN